MKKNKVVTIWIILIVTLTIILSMQEIGNSKEYDHYWLERIKTIEGSDLDNKDFRIMLIKKYMK
jgi:hypothetical protein